MLDTYSPSWMTEDLEIFKDAVNKFYTREFVPHSDRWTKEGIVDRDAWYKAGEAGILCASIPEEYGGGGGTYAHEAILTEEMERCGVAGLAIRCIRSSARIISMPMGPKNKNANGCPKWRPASLSARLR